MKKFALINFSANFFMKIIFCKIFPKISISLLLLNVGFFYNKLIELGGLNER